jgi:hypothetical protein
MRPADAPAPVLDREVVGAAADARRPWEALASLLGGPGGASGGQDAYFLAIVTVS